MNVQGGEPEAIDSGVVGSRTYAFVGAERNSGLFVYDITDPANSQVLQYVARRAFTEDATEEVPGADLGPEYIQFVSAAESPMGVAFIIVSNEVCYPTTVSA